MTWHSASRWLSTLPCTFISTRSVAKDSPAAGAWSAVPVIGCRAGCGLSAVCCASTGTARLTVRPSVTPAAAARTCSGPR